MPQFKNKEEYEKWKAERVQTIKKIAEAQSKPKEAPTRVDMTLSEKPKIPTEKKCPHCAMMIPKEAKICPHCRRKQLATATTAQTVVAFIIILMLFAWIGYRGGCGSTTSTSSSVSIGQEGFLDSGTELVPVAIDQIAFDEWTKARVAKDEQGMLQLILQGRIVSVEKNTKIKIIDQGMFIRKVRILDGKHQGVAGWVAYEYIKPL